LDLAQLAVAVQASEVGVLEEEALVDFVEEALGLVVELLLVETVALVRVEGMVPGMGLIQDRYRDEVTVVAWVVVVVVDEVKDCYCLSRVRPQGIEHPSEQ
jgi:hypothetical protein